MKYFSNTYTHLKHFIFRKNWRRNQSIIHYSINNIQYFYIQFFSSVNVRITYLSTIRTKTEKIQMKRILLRLPQVQNFEIIETPFYSVFYIEELYIYVGHWYSNENEPDPQIQKNEDIREYFDFFIWTWIVRARFHVKDETFNRFELSENRILNTEKHFQISFTFDIFRLSIHKFFEQQKKNVSLNISKKNKKTKKQKERYSTIESKWM